MSVVSRRRARAVVGTVICLAALVSQSDRGSFAQEQVANNMDMPERVLLTAGRSTVLNTDFDITRIAVTNPEVADAVVVRPREVLVDGKGAGTVSLIVWGAATRKHYDVVVDRGVSTLQQNLQALFPGENITIGVTDDAVILSGAVSSNEVMLRAAEVAKAALPKASIINMLQLPGGSPSKQVLLQVRFAEVNRNALQEAGLALFASRPNFVGRSTTRTIRRADVRRGQCRLQRLPEPVLFPDEQGIWRRAEGARGPRVPPESCRAEPDRLQRRRGQLSRRRRDSGAGRQRLERQRQRHLQGIRHPPELQADDRRRRHPAEGETRGEHARFQQRRHPQRLPHPGADYPARRNRRRAAGRPVVCNSRPLEQPVADRQTGDSFVEPAADYRHRSSRASRIARNRPS